MADTQQQNKDQQNKDAQSGEPVQLDKEAQQPKGNWSGRQEQGAEPEGGQRS
jgi:hypothetical protein